MFRYENLTSADEAVVMELYARILNDGANMMEVMKKRLSLEGTTGIKCYDGDRVVAVVFWSPGINFTYPHPELEQKIAAEFPSDVIYSAEMIAVEDDYRKHGIGKELSIRMYEKAMSRGATHILMELWTVDGNCRAEALAKHAGKIVMRVDCPDFYKDLNKHGIICPECKDGCGCAAVVLVIKM